MNYGMLNNLIQLGGLFAFVAGAAWVGIQFYGKQRVEALFDTRLEEFKKEKQAELIQLKQQTDAILNRSRLNQQSEFERLPQLWEVLADLVSSVRGLGNGLYELPDFNKYTQEDLSEFVESQDWHKNTKTAFLSSTDKSSFLLKVLRVEQINKVYGNLRSYNTELTKSSIFIPAELHDKCLELADKCKSVTAQYKISDQVKNYEMSVKATNEMEQVLIPLFEELRSIFRKHLKEQLTDETVIIEAST